ncbi:histidine kinase [Deinococcus sp. SDU3-2]|uniref:histidine kinase n=1 Tax=Deinococcus terrestris TaxID=2651870 RepID=A0A7X1NWP6_9DEIO|nr:ATP-binding protein [Deinococcus terrestris]MPY67215.1 histidine kinase [Deinococcus terrestris]
MTEAPPTPRSDAWMDALGQAVLLFGAVQGGPPTVLRVNAAAARLWGVPQERAAGRPLLEVVRRHTLEALAERGGELELEMAGRTLRCTATRAGAGEPGALIVEDVTEHRRREAELREAAAVLSHEFRTPVAGLRGVLEALEYDLPPELARKFVGQGLQEVERLGRLVEDLAVGFRPTRARTLPLAEAFARAERLLAPEVTARGATLTFGDDHLVRADPDKLLQVLLNLVENALRYGPPAGAVEIATSGRGAWVEVAVLDHGAPLGDTGSLFRAHTRGPSADGQGSGMGLYIVRSIVEGWGGQVWAERRGERNAFCFTLPGGGHREL